MEKETKTLYNLELHECLQTPFGISIMRVPNGWIYDAWNSEKDEFKAGVFVPYNSEFKPEKPFDPDYLI